MSNETWTVAGAFVLGAALGVLATLRILRAITTFFSGVERRRNRPLPRIGDDDE